MGQNPSKPRLYSSGKSDHSQGPNPRCEVAFVASRTAAGIPQLLACPWALALPIQELPEPRLEQSLVERPWASRGLGLGG